MALMFLTYFIVALTVGGLTARLRAREHLAAQIHVAEESERLRKTLLDCISHELKTPVAAISAASEALLAAPAAGQAEVSRQLATEIHDGSSRLNRVVDNLLDMTRLESGVIEPKREWCDVRDLLEAAIESERAAMNGRGFEFDLAENCPLVLLDCGLVEQAVAKLVANACSYAPTETPIEIRARCRDGALVISVSDRGPGIAAGQEGKVFEKFHRGDQSKTGGLGLGLSIARGFVEAHGGTVTAENRPGAALVLPSLCPTRMADPQSMKLA